MRPVALGRKYWIHIGGSQAGPRIAAILIDSANCRRLKLPVRDALAAVFPGSSIALSGGSLNFAPGAWTRRHPP
jgi:transposase